MPSAKKLPKIAYFEYDGSGGFDSDNGYVAFGKPERPAGMTRGKDKKPRKQKTIRF